MMLMSVRSIQRTKNYSLITKDDVGELWSQTHNGKRPKKGRRAIKRAERNNVRKEITRERNAS